MAVADVALISLISISMLNSSGVTTSDGISIGFSGSFEFGFSQLTAKIAATATAKIENIVDNIKLGINLNEESVSTGGAI